MRKRECDVYGCHEKGWWIGYDKLSGDVVVCTEHRTVVGDCILLFKHNLPKSFKPRLCANHFQYEDGTWGHCVPNFHKHDGECNWTRPDEAGFV